MRKISWHLLGLLSLSARPLSAHALQVEFCVPDCSVGNPRFSAVSLSTQTVIDAAGVVTTTMPLGTFTIVNGARSFTVTATVTSQQSGTLQKIAFSPTTITVNAGSGCSVTSPCLLEITATSEPCDFPIEKPIGGYPAGVFMMGSFTGVQPLNNGDTISMTGEASLYRVRRSEPVGGAGFVVGVADAV